MNTLPHNRGKRCNGEGHVYSERPCLGRVLSRSSVWDLAPLQETDSSSPGKKDWIASLHWWSMTGGLCGGHDYPGTKFWIHRNLTLFWTKQGRYGRSLSKKTWQYLSITIYLASCWVPRVQTWSDKPPHLQKHTSVSGFSQRQPSNGMGASKWWRREQVGKNWWVRKAS